MTYENVLCAIMTPFYTLSEFMTPARQLRRSALQHATLRFSWTLSLSLLFYLFCFKQGEALSRLSLLTPSLLTATRYIFYSLIFLLVFTVLAEQVEFLSRFPDLSLTNCNTISHFSLIFLVSSSFLRFLLKTVRSYIKDLSTHAFSAYCNTMQLKFSLVYFSFIFLPVLLNKTRKFITITSPDASLAYCNTTPHAVLVGFSLPFSPFLLLLTR